MIPYIYANRKGIPMLESTGVSVSASAVTYTFNPHPFLLYPFTGLVLVRLAQSAPDGTTTTLPVQFSSGSTTTRSLTGFNGEAVELGDLRGTGIYLVFFDRDTNTLQLLTGFSGGADTATT